MAVYGHKISGTIDDAPYPLVGGAVGLLTSANLYKLDGIDNDGKKTWSDDGQHRVLIIDGGDTLLNSYEDASDSDSPAKKIKYWSIEGQLMGRYANAQNAGVE